MRPVGYVVQFSHIVRNVYVDGLPPSSANGRYDVTKYVELCWAYRIAQSGSNLSASLSGTTTEIRSVVVKRE